MYLLLVMHFAISLIQDGRHEKFSKFFKNRHFLTLFTYLWDPQDQEIWKLVLGRLKWYGYATFHCVLWNLTKYSMIERGHLIESWWFWVQDETCEKLISSGQNAVPVDQISNLGVYSRWWCVSPSFRKSLLKIWVCYIIRRSWTYA